MTAPTTFDLAAVRTARPVPSGRGRGRERGDVAQDVIVDPLTVGGASGMGAYHGKWGFEALSHRRAVLAKPAKPDPGLLDPPYSRRAMKIRRKLLQSWQTIGFIWSRGPTDSCVNY